MDRCVYKVDDFGPSIRPLILILYVSLDKLVKHHLNLIRIVVLQSYNTQPIPYLLLTKHFLFSQVI